MGGERMHHSCRGVGEGVKGCVPKSAILTYPWELMSRLDGLMSRWIFFMPCR